MWKYQDITNGIRIQVYWSDKYVHMHIVNVTLQSTALETAG